jgi:hypothetical protein
MRQQIINRIINIFKPPPYPALGRWQLKHDSTTCERYLTNNYADPGYPNCNKIIWIEKFKDGDYISKGNSIRNYAAK